MIMLDKVPLWYWIVTIVVTSYHAYRGYRFYWLDVAKRQGFAHWSTLDKVTVLCVQAAFLFMFCSLVGFFALLAAYHLLVTQRPMHSIDTGSAILIAFSFILGILGVSGELPHLVQQGKLPIIK